MREIIMRGYNEFEQEWVYGAYWYDSYISDSYIIPFGRQPIAILEETVGEFTGCYDSKRTKYFQNGQPIYEGDIVQCKVMMESDNSKPLEFIGKVEMINYMWQLTGINENKGISSSLLYARGKVVIGNIHGRRDEDED